MAGPIKVACLGAGYFSRFHYDAWRRIDEVELVGAADLAIDRAASTGLPAFADLSSMLSSVTPDVLDIITKPPTHLDAIREALEAGIKLIICQKPLCNSLDEVRVAIELAAQADARLVVHENFRFQPWFRCMAKAVDDGLVGKVHQFTFRLRPGDGQGADAYLDRQPYFREMPRLLIHETGVHFIDVFRFMLGMPRAVYADLRRLNTNIAGEDAGFFIFEYEDGCRAMFDGNRHLDHAAENTRITMGEALLEGDRGSLSLTGDGTVTFRSFGSRDLQTLLPGMGWAGFGGDCVYALQHHVVQGLLTGSPIENQASEYLSVIELEELVYRAAREHRKQELS
ncbi:Gfo/Idh/MocA family protein [Granulosicoccus sp. 3-233]